MSDLTDFFSELGNKQRDRMVRRFFTDQHGRRFFAWADKFNQRPIGELALADESGTWVTPPFLPAMQFIHWPQVDGLNFEWTYEKMADEYSVYTADWYDEAAKLARFIKVEIPIVGGDVPPEVLSIMGPPPLSPEIPLACQAGDLWILGRKGIPEHTALKHVVDRGRTVTSKLALDMLREKVKRMVESGASQTVVGSTGPLPEVALTPPPSSSGITYNQFIAEARRAGQTMADAAVAWKAHKDNLAAEKTA